MFKKKNQQRGIRLSYLPQIIWFFFLKSYIYTYVFSLIHKYLIFFLLFLGLASILVMSLLESSVPQSCITIFGEMVNIYTYLCYLPYFLIYICTMINTWRFFYSCQYCLQNGIYWSARPNSSPRKVYACSKRMVHIWASWIYFCQRKGQHDHFFARGTKTWFNG